MSRSRVLRPFFLLALTAGAALGLLGSSHVRAEPGPLLRLNPPGDPRGTFEVAGLDAAATTALSRADLGLEAWSALFAVTTVDRNAPADAAILAARPPILGTHRVEAGVLRFRPRFPLEPGVVYRARFDPSKLPGSGVGLDVREAEFSLPKTPATPSTRVSAVYPTRDTLPDNLLKLYLHFSAPMGRGAAYEHIHLRDAEGKDLVFPFLELGEELWDPSGQRLTVLFDPGRIKRGLKPREEFGPILRPGGRYTLVIDSTWLDAEGQPLVSEYRKTFRAGPADQKPPDPSTWTLTVPDAGTTGPLILSFPEPLDRAMLARVIAIEDARGNAVTGEVAIDQEETRWRFTPHQRWEASAYRVSVSKDLEDLAGNSIGRMFEVDVFDRVDRHPVVEFVTLPFRVEARAPSR